MDNFDKCPGILKKNDQYGSVDYDIDQICTSVSAVSRTSDLQKIARTILANPKFNIDVFIESLSVRQAPADFVPCEKWNERQDRKENIVDFTNRVYGQVLVEGAYTRNMLRKADKSLLSALNNKFRNNQWPSLNVLNLPKNHQLMDRMINEKMRNTISGYKAAQKYRIKKAQE